ncbi:MAG: tRNA lysidine(34) synthetase TilS [Patescibacteria group bacterium]|nr:tRNA lysidine(34) synthetase TilS [Patescibacteria group bacterium]
MMEKVFEKIIEKYSLREKRIILAVSGGVDSAVLLYLSQKMLPRDNLIVAHINHGLRRESENEAIFVRGLARNYGLIFYSKDMDLNKKDEATSRQKRYEYLNWLASKETADYILTAHHLSDQVETVLLNLTRGSGPLDLWGMEELNGNILRPFLAIPKAEILNYAKKNKIRFVTDESNSDINYSRNRIRKNVVPELKKINPKFEEGVKKSIQLSGELKSFVDLSLLRVEKNTRDKNRLKISTLKKESIFIVKALILKMLHEHLGQNHNVYSKNVEEVFKILNSSENKKTKIGKLLIEKEYDYLVFRKDKKNNRLIEKKLTLNSPELFGSHVLVCKIGSVTPQKNNVLLPLEFSDNLRVRTWQAGDKIKTVAGTKKIQDVFSDAKVPKAKRDLWPIVVHKKEIVWVPLLAAKKYKKEKNNLIVEVK